MSELLTPTSLRARCARSEFACVITRGDAPFSIAACNPRWSWLCGWSQSEALGKSPSQLLHGPGTDISKASAFAAQLQHGAKTASVTLVNYSRIGMPFVHKVRWNVVNCGNTRGTVV